MSISRLWHELRKAIWQALFTPTLTLTRFHLVSVGDDTVAERPMGHASWLMGWWLVVAVGVELSVCVETGI
jgi:hypothetical protein